MIQLHNKYKSSVIASKKVNQENVSRWGIFDFKKINKRDFLIKDVVEKPSIKSAPSYYAVIGRYILPRKIFNILQNVVKDYGTTVILTTHDIRMMSYADNLYEINSGNLKKIDS